MTTTKKRKPRQRPTRKVPAKRKTIDGALERAVAADGIDPESIDPRRILAAIANDQDAPAGARVMACKTLIVIEAAPADDYPPPLDTPKQIPADELTTRALSLLSTRQGN